jgi:hypothetical protein
LLEALFDHGPRDLLAGVGGTREHVEGDALGTLTGQHNGIVATQSRRRERCGVVLVLSWRSTPQPLKTTSDLRRYLCAILGLNQSRLAKRRGRFRLICYLRTFVVPWTLRDAASLTPRELLRPPA